MLSEGASEKRLLAPYFKELFKFSCGSYAIATERWEVANHGNKNLAANSDEIERDGSLTSR